MSIFIYSCNQCKRQIEIIDEPSQLVATNHCVITQNCKGNLYKTGTRSDGIINKQIQSVEGLQDYQAVPRLYQHDQLLPSSSWTITHNLHCKPVVYVYSKNNQGLYTLLNQDTYVVVDVDVDTTVVQFGESTIGTVQLISKSNVAQPEPQVVDTSAQPCSANGILTIATPVFENDSVSVPVSITTVSPTTGISTTIIVDFLAHKKDSSIALFNSPWREVQTILYQNTLMRVRSVRISNFVTQNSLENNSPFTINDNANAIVLLSNLPYQATADIALDRKISFEQLSSAVFTNTITDNQMLVNTQNIEKTFPLIAIHKTISQ